MFKKCSVKLARGEGTLHPDNPLELHYLESIKACDCLKAFTSITVFKKCSVKLARGEGTLHPDNPSGAPLSGVNQGI